MPQLIFSNKAGIYSPLKDTQSFNQACIELGPLTWTNDADLDLAWLQMSTAWNITV
jgi:hypothetical protein